VIIKNQTAGCLRVVSRFYGPSIMAVNLRVIMQMQFWPCKTAHEHYNSSDSEPKKEIPDENFRQSGVYRWQDGAEFGRRIGNPVSRQSGSLSMGVRQAF
jgi:hypothetical protein